MAKKPFILITNDDGIHAPGIDHLWRGLKAHADVAIIAPAHDQSGAGLKITLREPLHIENVHWEEKAPAWKVTGTPSDCIRLGLSVILKQRPDLIVSGINRGANSGKTVLYSGTVGAAIEGTFQGIPSIAFSSSNFEEPHYGLTEKYLYPLVSHFLDTPLPPGTFLNVTFPETLKEGIRGIKMASQGQSYLKEDPERRLHPDGYAYYWLSCRWSEEKEEEESDVSLLKKGYVTAVPIHVAQLTDFNHLKQYKNAFETSFESLFPLETRPLEII
jgi:5'-nucleotidase